MGQRTQPQTIVAWLAAVVGGRPTHPALIADGQIVSYGELWERSGAIARWLLDEGGFRPGSTVGLIGRNCPDYITAYFGVLRAGGVIAPLNERVTPAEITAQLAMVGAVGVLTTDRSDEPAETLGGDVPVWPIDKCRSDRAARIPVLGSKSSACILLTSGSTGRPKGVVHSHGTLLHASSQLATVMPFGQEERALVFLPFYASIPEAVLPVLLTGGSLEILERFDPDAIAHACERATTFDIVPTLMARLLDHGDHDALRRLRWIFFASEPMPVALLERWWDALPGVATHQLYGMTECLTITHASPAHMRSHPLSVGLPFPTSTLSVIDTASGLPVETGTPGEVTCRTPARMVGYLGDAPATLAATSTSGAMRTGDLGQLDEDGSLTLTGRLKDLIISGGLNVAPAEIEAVACRHPAVASAIVIGVPDSRWGETPVVVAIPQAGQDLAPHDLLTFCSRELAGFKRPSAAAVVDTLPTTGIGKSSKGTVRQLILNGEIALVRRV